MATPDAPGGNRPREHAPSPAERSRTLVAAARTGALSTLARDPEGFPYGSLVLVAADALGRPLLLLSSLAEHTQNLAQCSHASVLVSDAFDGRAGAAVTMGGDPPSPPLTAVTMGETPKPLARPGDGASPLASARVTLLGTCSAVGAGERDAVRTTFLLAHPEAAAYADFRDFAFHRLDPVSLRYVGGFGRMSWITARDYLSAEPDPLAPSAADILAHMNGDHADAVLAYARGLAGVADAQAATMTGVDRYGFDLMATTPGGERGARVPFTTPVATSDEVRRAMVALVKAARAALG